MSLFTSIKRILLGKPIHRKHAHHERLTKFFGLPVFASDALSSVAYASEEILHILVTAGPLALWILNPVSLWLGVLMIIVAFSYYQTIFAYPKGGGTYLVSTENLGSMAGRTAGAALLIDYVLTVAVSISAGSMAVISAFPGLKSQGVLIAIAATAALAIANLRGAKESGMLFAIPTYTFVASILALIALGLYKTWGHTPLPAPHIEPPIEGFHAIALPLYLRAFAASCTALTGTEAIADGVQAFKPPEAKNAAQTLIIMVALLLCMFLGLSYVASQLGIVPFHAGQEPMTVVAQIAYKLSGDQKTWFFYLLQASTALILFLAANTAFADFPRLCSFIAKDGFMPRQLLSLGDRLVFQNGVLLLALAAIGLIVTYGANTHSLIPLYAIGVFISFTLSQAGMTVKWYKARKDWRMYVNGIGTITTFVVAIILAVTKFSDGAWLILVAMSFMLLIFWRIKKHYDYLATELSLTPTDSVTTLSSTALLLVPRVHRGILQAIGYARTMATDVRAIHVTLDPGNTQQIKEEWSKFGADIPLVILESPYRSMLEPIIHYIDQALEDEPNHFITVIVPEAVPKKWWHNLLHNNAAIPLKLALASRRNIIVTNVRYFLQ